MPSQLHIHIILSPNLSFYLKTHAYPHNIKHNSTLNVLKGSKTPNTLSILNLLTVSSCKIEVIFARGKHSHFKNERIGA